jgi:hypothetical protein
MGTIISRSVSTITSISSIKGFSPVTGTTTETIGGSISVPPNTVQFESAEKIVVRATKTGTAGTLGVAIYADTTSDLTGSPVLIGRASVGATSLYLQLERTLFVVNAAVTNVASTAAATGTSDNISSTNSGTDIAIDWGIQQYIIATITNGNAGDSTLLNGITLKLFP